MKVENPNLAMYKGLNEYSPQYGDYIIWSRLFSTWHGFIVDYDKDDKVYILFAGLPFLLFTMSEKEQSKETKQLSLQKIKNATQGSFAIQRHDKQRNVIVWYI